MTNNEKIKLIKIQNLKTKENNEALEELLKFLFDKNIFVKIAAIEALSYYNNFPKAKKALIEILNDADSELRYYSIESLSYFSCNDVGNAIILKLNDPDELVRISATEALGNMKFTKSISNLQQALMDKSELVRRNAAEALGKIGDRKIIPVLEEFLNKERRSAARLGFYTGLYLLGENKYFSFILNLLKSKSYKTRCATANTLIIFADSNNVKIIIEYIEKALSKETTLAAKSTFLEVLEELQEIK